MEGRELAKENPRQQNAPRTRSRSGPPSALERVREAAAKDRKLRFTAPLLANIYLHYAFDLWVRAWSHKQATGAMVVVRYADDVVRGFQRKADAERIY